MANTSKNKMSSASANNTPLFQFIRHSLSMKHTGIYIQLKKTLSSWASYPSYNIIYRICDIAGMI